MQMELSIGLSLESDVNLCRRRCSSVVFAFHSNHLHHTLISTAFLYSTITKQPLIKTITSTKRPPLKIYHITTVTTTTSTKQPHHYSHNHHLHHAPAHHAIIGGRPQLELRFPLFHSHGGSTKHQTTLADCAGSRNSH